MADRTKFRRKNIRLPQGDYTGWQWYFLTACTEGRTPRLQKAELVARHLALLSEQSQKDSFDIVAYCFMPDHLHVLVGAMSEDSNCVAFMRAFKQRSGFEFRQSCGERLWQHKYYDHILRSHELWESVAWYIWMNPVRKGLCARPEDWPFSGSQSMDWKRLLQPPDTQWAPPWKRATT